MLAKKVTRKDDILRCAIRLFRAKGYDATTMQDIMRAQDIAKGTIYHYYSSKEVLFDEVIEVIAMDSIAETESRMETAEGDALQKFQLLIESGQIYEENRSLIDHLHSPGKEALHTRLLAATLTKSAPIYAKIIEQGCAEGLFHTEIPLECAEYILAAAQFLTDIGVYPWDAETLKRRILALPVLIEKQLGAKKGSFAFLAARMAHCPPPN
jgi:AcrR family transcriptional regulator